MSKPIIKNHAIVADHWQHIDDEAVLPATGDIIVGYTRWQKDRDVLIKHKGKLGITIGNGISDNEIKADLQHFDLIAIAFPEFKDGRGYSYARLLRERHGYQKEIRAIGNILRDQLRYMERCGFDAFELQADRNIQDALNAFNELTTKYQPAVDGPPTASI